MGGGRAQSPIGHWHCALRGRLQGHAVSCRRAGSHERAWPPLKSEAHFECLRWIDHLGLPRDEMGRPERIRRQRHVCELQDRSGRADPEFFSPTIDIVDALTGLLPWESASGEVAKSYDSALFKGSTLQDIPDAPFFVFCATNLQTGVLWRFTKSYAGDYVIG